MDMVPANRAEDWKTQLCKMTGLFENDIFLFNACSISNDLVNRLIFTLTY